MKEIKRYNMRILGRNTMTPPTPPTMPSTTKSLSTPLGNVVFSSSENQPTSESIHPIGYLPNEKVHSNMIPTKKRKIGKPRYLLVTNLSIVFVSFRSSVLLMTSVSVRAPVMNPYF